MEKITILLTDDHMMLRDMWEQLLNNHPSLQVIASTGDGAEAIHLAKKLNPAIILMDISMYPVDGFETTRQISACCKDCRIIGVSMHTHILYAKQLFQAGAKGYITKNSSKDELIAAILQVAGGGIYICEEMRDIVSQEALFPESNQTNKILTLRQIEVISLLKEGLSSKEISAKLDVSLKTVQVHRYNILKKLKIKNTAALINFANTIGV